MGYTHYWRTNEEIPPETWKKICNRISAARKYFDNPLGQFELTDDAIYINGLGADSYETFYFARVGDGFGFCKTAQQLYDVLVVASLLLIEFTVDKSIKISSDGNQEDLGPGYTFALRVIQDEMNEILVEMGGEDG